MVAGATLEAPNEAAFKNERVVPLWRRERTESRVTKTLINFTDFYCSISYSRCPEKYFYLTL